MSIQPYPYTRVVTRYKEDFLKKEHNSGILWSGIIKIILAVLNQTFFRVF